VPAETLCAALAETKQLIRPRNDAYVDYFGHRYSYLRQFTPLFLQRLTFRSSHDHDPLLEADEAGRRRINRQLNKGEALHSLRSAISIANKGQLRRKQEEALTNQAGCLNLVTNAIILWNTVYMAAVTEQLKAEGYPVQDSDLAHVWPT
jgi:Tn3 transposase DDE domain